MRDRMRCKYLYMDISPNLCEFLMGIELECWALFQWPLVMQLHSYPETQALMSRLEFVSFLLNHNQITSAYQAAYWCRNIFINGLMNDLMSRHHILQAGEPNSYLSLHLQDEIHNRCATFSSEEHLTWFKPVWQQVLRGDSVLSLMIVLLVEVFGCRTDCFRLWRSLSLSLSLSQLTNIHCFGLIVIFVLCCLLL